MPSISSTPSIYQIRHIESGKVYVGSAVNPRKRWREHGHYLRHGTHHSRYLQRAWDKYGKDAFAFEIIEPVLFVEDLIAREQHWIDTLHAAEWAHGFNGTPTAGSSLGMKRSDEERVRMSERAKAQFSDPAHRAAHAARAKAQFSDPAERTKLSERAKAQFSDPAERERMSERAKALFDDPDYRAQHAAKRKTLGADPIHREKLSRGAQARWADPNERAKRSELTKAQMADPENRAKMVARAKAQWADPEFRARQMALRAEQKKKHGGLA